MLTSIITIPLHPLKAHIDINEMLQNKFRLIIKIHLVLKNSKISHIQNKSKSENSIPTPPKSLKYTVFEMDNLNSVKINEEPNKIDVKNIKNLVNVHPINELSQPKKLRDKSLPNSYQQGKLFYI